MKEIIVISGKGGTGKTSIVSAFATLAQNKVLCDADVDASDLHLIMTPNPVAENEFRSGYTASIKPEECSQCGTCRDLCRFGAISDDFVIDPVACEGCGVCYDLCPEDAIEFSLNTSGEWYISETRFGPMVHARLGIAEENSGKLVTLVRQNAKKIAEEQKLNWIITDGPPGVSCPVIASISGADMVFIITEPTVSGIHDMKRVIELCEFFKVPVMICINKFDLNPEKTIEIEQFAAEKQIPCIGKIPFDPIFVKSMVNKQTIVEYDAKGPATRMIEEIWRHIETSLS